MKKVIAVVGILALIGIMAIPVLAQGPCSGRGGYGTGAGRGGPGDCPRYQGRNDSLTTEQRDQLDKLHQTFNDETAQLRSDLSAKRGELRILLTTSNPDETKAMTLQREVSDLKAKMADKRLQYAFEARKINPDAMAGWGFGKGFHGRGMRGGFQGADCPNFGGRGGGRGMGPGFSKGGSGQGACCN